MEILLLDATKNESSLLRTMLEFKSLFDMMSRPIAKGVVPA